MARKMIKVDERTHARLAELAAERGTEHIAIMADLDAQFAARRGARRASA